MQHRSMFLLTLTLFALTAAAGGASSSEDFDALVKPYETIRLALVDDSTEGVAEEAEAIAAQAKDLAAEKATPEAVKTLLPEIAKAAGKLAEAPDLAAAREAFYALSQALVRYRSHVEGERPVVAYCPMAAKSWLQPDGEIGNPYYGQSMARCGEVVER